ncbi:MAG TPA: hypothetical protein ENI55_05990 [Alphaproteobacteria bacterium]|nr:hypothetical protein [Alphaproteobacteria bacterium]
MKIKIEVDCTPQEARTFIGLPDVGPLQKKIMAEMEERMKAAMNAGDMETIFKAWMPGGMADGARGFGDMGKMFRSAFSAAAKAAEAGGEKKKDQ